MNTPDDLAAKAAALEGEVLRPGEGEPGGGSDVGSEDHEKPSRYGVALGKIIHVTFKAAAPNWGVTLKESMMLGEGYGQVIDAFFPTLDLGKKIESIILAGSFTYFVLEPRAGMPLRKEDQPKAADGHPDGKETKPAG